MKKLLLLFLPLTSLFHLAYSQVRIAPEVGLNLSTYIPKSKFEPAIATVKPGLRLGFVADIPLNDHWIFQTGASFVQNGFIHTSVDDVQIGNINSIEIPTSLTYKYRGFFFGLGEYNGININGKSREEGFFQRGETEIKIGLNNPDAMSSIDLGAYILTGYQTNSGVFVKAFFQNGFINEAPSSYAIFNGKLYHRNFGLTAGYYFGKKNQKKSAVGVRNNVHLGLQVGVNLSNYADHVGKILPFKLDAYSSTGPETFLVEPQPGIRAGALAQIDIDESFALQPGLSFVSNGTKATWQLLVTSTRMSTIELPINFIYKIKHFFVGAGPFLALNIHDRNTYSYNGAGVAFDIAIKPDNTSIRKAWDAGLGAVLGYQHKNGFFVKGHYQCGLLTQYADDDIDWNSRKTYNSNCGLSVGYFFGDKNVREID